MQSPDNEWCDGEYKLIDQIAPEKARNDTSSSLDH